MTFDVAAEAYDTYMGRFSIPLAGAFVTAAGVRAGQHVLDVGSGPGALTGALLAAGAQVSAIDPSPPFITAMQERFPTVDARLAPAESLPFDDDAFDVTLAQLVVLFMSDPAAGVREMVRVTKPGGLVGANVWDHAGDGGPLSLFWRAVVDLDPAATDEAHLVGTAEGQLVELLTATGLDHVHGELLAVPVSFADLEAWWAPFTLGVGPAGAYVDALDADHRAALRTRCGELLPPAPFTVQAAAWTAFGRA